MQHTNDISCPGDLAVLMNSRCEGEKSIFTQQADDRDRDGTQFILPTGHSERFHNLLSCEKKLLH